MRKIHLAIGSTTSKPADVTGNLKQIEAFARRAGQEGADLLLTPEMSVSGYGPYPEVLATAEVAGDGPVYRGLAALARSTGVTICAGFVEAAGSKRHLAHYAVYPSGEFVVQRKHRVTKAEVPLNGSVPCVLDYTPVDPADPGQPTELKFNFFTVKNVKCGIAICFDGGIKNLHEHFVSNGADVLLGPTGAGGKREDRVVTQDLYTEEGREKYQRWVEMTCFPGGNIKACLKHGLTIAAVNMCGWDGQKQYHMGHGTIVTPMGEIAALFHGLPNIDRQRPCYASAVIDVDERLNVR